MTCRLEMIARGDLATPRSCPDHGLSCPKPTAAENQFAQSQGVVSAPMLTALDALGLSKAEEGAMELALIRPDLLTTEQVQTIAQALKNRNRKVDFSALSNLQAAALQSGSAGAPNMRYANGGVEHR